MQSLLPLLISTSDVPTDDRSFAAWLEQEDSLHLLRTHLNSDNLILYASLPHTYIHTVLVPTHAVSPPDVKSLMEWNFNPCQTWGVWSNFADPPDIGISPPLEHTGSTTIDGGEQLVYLRYFERRPGDFYYVDISQKLIHVLDAHFVPEKSAYCRVDRHGDLEEVISILDTDDSTSGIIVTARREDLDEFMVLTNSVAVTTFDFPRFRSGWIGWTSNATDPVLTEAPDLSYEFHLEPGYASYVRGYQLIRSRLSGVDLARRYSVRHRDGEQQHATFIISDWRHDVIAEVSCGPGSTATYFNAGQNDLPFEVSPAFFRPEVLLKYKSDSEKYRLDTRSITCRGAWHLKTYDINDAGQVHTYLRYLRDLPYEEQLHWKAYNEEPKSGISRRAFQTDFKGEWSEDYDPLINLKRLLEALLQERVPWWRLRSDDLPHQVHYPATTSPDEWSDAILKLDQLIVEGFEEKWLRQRAVDLGRTPPAQLRSLKLLEECLIALDFEEEHARGITSPLHEVHNLRSKLKGHATGGTSTNIRRDVLTKHKTFRRHFTDLCTRCDESLKTIVEAFGGP